MNLIDRLRELQKIIRETGLGMSTLALPAPKLLLLPSSQDEISKQEILFSHLVTEPEVESVSRDLFESGFYNLAVFEAFKALNKFIQEKSCRNDLSDRKLMQQVFSESNPTLFWSERNNISEKDEQKGYMLIYDGSFAAIRNPCGHETDWIDDHQTALDAILIAQHLLRKAKAASISPPSPTQSPRITRHCLAPLIIVCDVQARNIGRVKCAKHRRSYHPACLCLWRWRLA